jgi:hypothetical protein
VPFPVGRGIRVRTSETEYSVLSAFAASSPSREVISECRETSGSAACASTIRAISSMLSRTVTPDGPPEIGWFAADRGGHTIGE